MRYALIFIFVLGSLAGSAQNIVLLDSLKKRLAAAKGKEEVDLMNAVGFEYRYSFPDSTIFYCTMAYNLGREQQLQKELSKPLSFIGLAYNNKGDYQNAIKYHNQSIDVAIEQSDSVQLAFGFNNLGRMFFDQGDLVRAYDNFIRAKDIFEVLHEKSGLAYVYRSMANIYSSQKDYRKALEMSQTAYDLRQSLGDQRLIISSLMELGLINQSAGNKENALACFLKADSIAATYKDPVTHAELEVGLAEIYLSDKRWEEASEHSLLALQGISENTNQRIFLRATYVQAQYYYEKGDLNRALALLNKLYQSAEKSGNVAFQGNASFLLAEIYRKTRDIARAIDFENKHKIFTEMVQNSDLSRQIDRLQFQLDLEKKEKENEKLKANEIKNKIVIEQQRFQNIVLLLVVAGVAAIAVVIWISNRKRRIINHKLALQNTHILLQREEIARQNENLSTSNQILSDLNQEKNTLMNIVAHDLKSPLNRIYGLSELLAMESPLTPAQSGYLKLIKDSTKAGLDLITDLLDVNELEEVKGKVNISQVDLPQLMTERIKSLQLAADQKSIRLSYQAEGEPIMKSDANYISRIVDNLISNAIKFSPVGSSIEVRTSRTHHHAVISVKDQGPGFSALDRQFLFQKFKKLSARPTGGESSNGLGLAIVKTLVDRLKGTIDLKSEPGKGSEFVIQLPSEHS